ncbi:MAG: hypothetical protein U9N73_07755 [Candidatus Auribacterota bacterium]|nr:hypothetical protein [Candidatus Auribacterota bacterium]
MQLSNVLIFAGVFRGSMVFGSAPSGSLALRYEAEKTTKKRSNKKSTTPLVGVET